jgi:hypothetical protein
MSSDRKEAQDFPVELLCDVFAEFLDDSDNIAITADDLNHVQELCLKYVRPEEAAREQSFHEWFGKFAPGLVLTKIVIDRNATDGVIRKKPHDLQFGS